MEAAEKNLHSENSSKENMTMRKRQRKKWLKKHGKYVPYSDLWSLDITIAKFVLPRLKKFKKENIGYPGIEEMDTHEKWDEALDKMILAFEYVISWDDWWLDNPRYDYLDAKSKYDDEYVTKIRNSYLAENKRRQVAISEGLQLFAKWFLHL